MTVANALEQLVPGLLEIYGEFIDSIILYGSVARGTQTDESDIDIALIMHKGYTKDMHDRMLDLIVDLELNCDKVLSVLPVDAERFDEWVPVLDRNRISSSRFHVFLKTVNGLMALSVAELSIGISPSSRNLRRSNSLCTQ